MKSMLKVGLLSSLLFASSQITATELDEFSVLVLGPLDGRAVVKLPNGKMQVVGNGETLPGTQATVKQILSDRLVVEEAVGDDVREAQTVWLYKAAGPGEPSRVKRLQITPPPKTLPKLTITKDLK